MSMTTSISAEKISFQSNWAKIGDNEGGILTKFPLGSSVTPSGIPNNVPAKIPINIAALTSRATRTAVTSNPIRTTQTCLSAILPNVTKVAELATTKPECCNPMNVINKPIPTGIASFNVFGILFTINSRTLKKVKTRKISPSIKTAVIAICQE
ncbi:hypothetical protein D3C80_762510 [compost metagenome]